MTETGERVSLPEVPFNRSLMDCLASVDKALLSARRNSPIVISEDSISVNNNGVNLFKVTASDILIAGQSFQDRLVSPSTSSQTSDMSQRLGIFLTGISDNLARLNHVGVSYYADDIEEGSAEIKRLVTASSISLHEEVSPNPKEKWFFLGDTENWEEPLTELVLNERGQGLDFWKPHFQIDIDTGLTLEKIKQLTDQYLGEDFIKWQLDIPGHGTVLAMGVLGQIGETKIALGIGTNLRGTEYHRKHELSLVEPK